MAGLRQASTSFSIENTASAPNAAKTSIALVWQMEKQWYLSRGDRRLGPFTLAKLQQLAAAGKVTREDRLCQHGTPEWCVAEDLEELFPRKKRAPRVKPVPNDEIVVPSPSRTVPPSVIAPYGGIWNGQPLAAQIAEFKAFGVECRRLAEYLVWRRLQCLILLPLSLLAMALGMYSFLKSQQEGLTTFGKFIQLSFNLSLIGLPLAAGVGVAYFRRFRDPSIAMLAGWTLSFVLPALLLFVPLTWQFNLDRATVMDRTTVAAIGGFLVIAQLMPLLFALPLGAFRGASRVRLLLPESGLSGCIMFGAAASLLVLFAIGLIFTNQIAPNPLPTLGFGLLLSAPILLLWNWQTLLRPVAPGPTKYPFFSSIQWFRGLFAAGVAVLILFLLSHEWNGKKLIGFEVTGSHIRPWNPAMWEFVTEFLARSLGTMVLFADLSLRSTVVAWKFDQELKNAGAGEDRDHAFATLEASL
jgi:hypothetical protein